MPVEISAARGFEQRGGSCQPVPDLMLAFCTAVVIAMLWLAAALLADAGSPALVIALPLLTLVVGRILTRL